MSHRATVRAGLQPAPNGLALVQDLLNTRAIGPHGTDLLDSVAQGRRWLREALEPAGVDPHQIGLHEPNEIAPTLHTAALDTAALDTAALDPDAAGLSWVDDLSDRDLRFVRDLRSDLVRLVSGVGTTDTEPTLVRSTMTVSPAGVVSLRPAGRGPGWFASAVWIQVYLAQQAGTWRRLKLCHNPPCGSAFYDRSKNNSGVWHDVKVCGNAVNLRASRARRRASAGQSPLG